MSDSQILQAVHFLYKVKTLHEAYRDMYPESRDTQFLGSCVDMIERRGTVTPGMMGWLNSLLDKGTPGPPTEDALILANRIEAAAPKSGVNEGLMREAVVLLRSGKTLSDTFTSRVNKTLALVDELGEPSAASDQELRAMSMARRVIDGYGRGWWESRFGQHKRALNIIEVYEKSGEIKKIDWALITEIAPRLREIAHPRHTVGKLMYVRHWNKFAVVCGPPEANLFGLVVYNVLVDGEVKQAPTNALLARAPRAV